MVTVLSEALSVPHMRGDEPRGQKGGYRLAVDEKLEAVGLTDLYDISYPDKPLYFRFPVTILYAVRLINEE